MQMILRIIGQKYISIRNALVTLSRRALHRPEPHPVPVLHHKDNVLPFRRPESRSGDPPAHDVKSVNNRR